MDPQQSQKYSKKFIKAMDVEAAIKAEIKDELEKLIETCIKYQVKINDGISQFIDNIRTVDPGDFNERGNLKLFVYEWQDTMRDQYDLFDKAVNSLVDDFERSSLSYRLSWAEEDVAEACAALKASLPSLSLSPSHSPT